MCNGCLSIKDVFVLYFVYCVLKCKTKNGEQKIRNEVPFFRTLKFFGMPHKITLADSGWVNGVKLHTVSFSQN